MRPVTNGKHVPNMSRVAYDRKSGAWLSERDQAATSSASSAARRVWYAKYRLPDGRQVQRKIGPAWPERGRPPAGHFTKRQAEDWLRDVLDQARAARCRALSARA